MKKLFVLALTLSLLTAARAATYTATNNANWNTAATWDPNGIPGVSDLAVIPSGKTVTYSGSPSTVGAVQVSGTLSVWSAGTFGDVGVDTTGTLNPTPSGANIPFGGSAPNKGNMSIPCTAPTVDGEP